MRLRGDCQESGAGAVGRLPRRVGQAFRRGVRACVSGELAGCAQSVVHSFRGSGKVIHRLCVVAVEVRKGESVSLMPGDEILAETRCGYSFVWDFLALKDCSRELC
ncbi:hypothetical protein GCM10010361_37710 [Streptomyces olivaceiscleroticus]|uniref:Uncharacterized protein n=1 Tax=Streptomyces olivaceiscleroticus TaxID=68245 RepID=A0ABP3K4B4_9ACTN